MRNIQHHVLIITCNDRNTLELIRQKAAELFKTYMEASSGSKLLTEIKESLINNYFTFFTSEICFLIISKFTLFIASVR